MLDYAKQPFLEWVSMINDLLGKVLIEARVVYRLSVCTRFVRPGFDPRRGMPLSKALSF